MIHVHRLHSILRPDKRELTLVEYRKGMTLRDALPGGGEYLATVNATRVPLDAPLSDGDHITYAADVHGPAVTVWLPIIGTFTTTVGLQYAFWGVVLYFANKFFAPSIPRQRDNNSSPQYAFSGIQTARTEGEAVAPIYGTIRTGGMVVNEYITAEGNSSTYVALIAYGEGPVYAIGDKTIDTGAAPLTSNGSLGGTLPHGLQLNGNNAENFKGVEAWVRLGALDQTVIPGFEDTRTQFSVDQDLTQDEYTGFGAAALVITPTNYNVTATTDPIWDQYGRVFDLTSETDDFEVLIEFPRGLFDVSSTGSIGPRTANFAVRYIELDAGNNPITTGGPEGDGYVRLRPDPSKHTLTVESPQPYFWVFRHQLVDPQQYLHPTVGSAAVLDGTNDKVVYPNPQAPWAINNNFVTLTVAFWCKKRSTSASQDPNVCTWANWVPNVWEEGFHIGFESNLSGVVVPTWQCFSSGSQITVQEPGTGAYSPPQDEWVHYVFTYQDNFSGTASSLFTVYVNSVVVHQTTATFNMRRPNADLVLGNDDLGTGSFPDIDLDELRVCNQHWTQVQVDADYNGGLGIRGFASGAVANVPGAVIVCPFEPSVNFQSNSIVYINIGVGSGGASIGAAGTGAVLLNQSTSAKRMKARVEVIRADLDSTNGRVNDDSKWNSVTAILNEKFSRPGTPLLALRIPASEQLNTSAPDVTVPVSGRPVPVWDGVSTLAPSLTRTFTPNPAWICLDLVLDDYFGMGGFYKAADVDLERVLSWANYNDQMLYDQAGRFDAQDEWTDILWNLSGSGTTSGVFGTLTVYFSAGGFSEFNGRYAEGDYVAFEGVNVVSASINNPLGATLDNTGGLGAVPGAFQITSISTGANTVAITASNLAAEPWPDGTLLSASVGGLTGVNGTLEGRERRHEFNGVLDEPEGGWDALLGVASVGKGVPVRVGSEISFRYEHPRSPVDIIGMANIIADSFEVSYGSGKDAPNVLSVDILDRALNWEATSVRVEHPSLQTASSFDNYREQTQFLKGVTSIRQAVDHAAFQLNVYNDVIRQGKFTLGPDALPLEVGDVVVLSHDLTQWGTSGRVPQTSSGAQIRLDRDIHMVVGKTYEVHVRDADTGAYEVADVLMSQYTLPTTITAGNVIRLTAQYTQFTPDVRDLYVFTAKGDDIRAQITSYSRSDTLEHAIEWVEYLDSVYDTSAITSEVLLNSTAKEPDENEKTIPNAPGAITVAQKTTRVAGGYAQTITASWSASTGRPASYNVWASRVAVGSGRAWRKVASANGDALSASFDLPGARAGETVLVAVQPVSFSGAAASPDSCLRRRIQIHLLAGAPGPPTNFAARMNGLEALYTWDPAPSEEPLRTVLRRGGWILGQRVASVAPGVNRVKTPDWSSGSADADGLAAPMLYARHLSDSGAASEAATLEFDADSPSSRELAQFTRETYEWHRSGWTGADADSDAPTKTNLSAQTDWRGRSYLEFSGSSLTASYTTGLGETTGYQRVRRCVVEAFAEAHQVWPGTPESIGDLPVGGIELSALTPEGWVNQDTLNTAPCTLTLEISVDGGAYIEFSPGIFTMASARIRVSLTRPNVDHQVRLYRLHTRIRWIRPETQDRSQVQQALEARLFG